MAMLRFSKNNLMLRIRSAAPFIYCSKNAMSVLHSYSYVKYQQGIYNKKNKLTFEISELNRYKSSGQKTTQIIKTASQSYFGLSNLRKVILLLVTLLS